MADSTDEVISVQAARPAFGEYEAALPGLSYERALYWRVELAGCGLRGLQIAPLARFGRYQIEWANPYQPGMWVVLASEGECMQAARGSYHLPIRPATVPGRTRRRDGELRGQAHFFDRLKP